MGETTTPDTTTTHSVAVFGFNFTKQCWPYKTILAFQVEVNFSAIRYEK